MRIFCTIMVILFLSLAVLSTVNLVVEWNGRCNNCTFGEDPATGEPYTGHHPTQCGVLLSSRIKSFFLTVVLYMCSATWVYLLWDAYRDYSMNKAEKWVGTSVDYIANMKNSYEQRQ